MTATNAPVPDDLTEALVYTDGEWDVASRRPGFWVYREVLDNGDLFPVDRSCCEIRFTWWCRLPAAP